jgi:hypothetical protein
MFYVLQLFSLPALTDGIGSCQVVCPYCREGLEAVVFMLMRLCFYIVLCLKWVIKILLDAVLCLKWVIKIPLDVVGCAGRCDALAKSIDDSLEIAVVRADEWQIQPNISLPDGVKKEGRALNDQMLNIVLDDTERLQQISTKWDPADGRPRTRVWGRWFYKFESLIHEIVLSLVLTSILVWTVTV